MVDVQHRGAPHTLETALFLANHRQRIIASRKDVTFTRGLQVCEDHTRCTVGVQYPARAQVNAGSRARRWSPDPAETAGMAVSKTVLNDLGAADAPGRIGRGMM
jgi:hypothetical protein